MSDTTISITDSEKKDVNVITTEVIEQLNQDQSIKITAGSDHSESITFTEKF